MSSSKNIPYFRHDTGNHWTLSFAFRITYRPTWTLSCAGLDHLAFRIEYPPTCPEPNDSGEPNDSEESEDEEWTKGKF